MANIETYDKWQDWAIRLQSLAQAGLYYTKNPYEAERYEEIRDISAQILAAHSTKTVEGVKEFFCCEVGYQTPKLDSRAVCFNDDGKLLMVQENAGQWTLPGGWVEVDLSIADNTIKEAREEAGAEVVPDFIICMHDWKKHVSVPASNLANHITKVFIMCSLTAPIKFQPNNETLQCDFFAKDEIPEELALGKTSIDQLDLCFKAHETVKSGKTWIPDFD